MIRALRRSDGEQPGHVSIAITAVSIEIPVVFAEIKTETFSSGDDDLLSPTRLCKPA